MGEILVSILIAAFENGKIIAEKPNLNESYSFKKHNEAEIVLVTDITNLKTYKQLEILTSMSHLADRDVYLEISEDISSKRLAYSSSDELITID